MTPISDEVALTGMTNLFIELCAQLDVDPHSAIDAFFKEVSNIQASDATEEIT